MARIFITGSADGLGLAAAQALLDVGHEVVVHVRGRNRLSAVRELVDTGRAATVVGDLSKDDETRDVADQVNRLPTVDAVIHNAGVYRGPQILPVNLLAPYLLTALIDGPRRLIYLSSSEHHSGRAELGALTRSDSRMSYPDSKLLVTTLALAVARRWPHVLANAVDPGWVPTKMGGPGAPDDLRLGHVTQAWLATSNEPHARTSGGYWYHQRRTDPKTVAAEPEFQHQLLSELEQRTGVGLTRHPLSSA